MKHTAFPDWASLVTWLLSDMPEFQVGPVLVSAWWDAHLPSQSPPCLVVYTSHRWSAPCLPAQAGRDAGRSLIGASWGKDWLVLSMVEEPPTPLRLP